MTTTFPPVAIKAIDRDSFDSSSVAANRDGSLLERSEWIINALSNDPTKLITAQSKAATANENATQQFTIAIANADKGSIPIESINMRSAKATMCRSRDGSNFTIKGVTQPTFIKETGSILCTYQFSGKEWQPKDVYKLSINGITADLKNTAYIPAMIWSNLITKFDDTNAKVATIKEDFRGVCDELANLTKQIPYAKDLVKTIVDKQTGIDQNSKDIYSRIVDDSKVLQSVHKSTNAIPQLLPKLVSQISDITKAIGALINSSESSFQNVVGDLVERLAAVFAILDTVSTKIGATDGNITKIQETVASLQKTIDNLQMSVTPILDKMNSNFGARKVLVEKIDEMGVVVADVLLKVKAVEDHLHTREYWYGKDFNSESNIGWLVSTQFENKFGESVKLSDGADFDYYINRICLTAANMPNELYRIRFHYGNSSFENAAILTEVVYIKAGNLLGNVPIQVTAPMIPHDNKLWCSILCTKPANLSLLIGIQH